MTWFLRIILLPPLVAAEVWLALLVLGLGRADWRPAGLEPAHALVMHAVLSPFLALALVACFPAVRRVNWKSSFLAFACLIAPLPLAGFLCASGLAAIMSMPARTKGRDQFAYQVGLPLSASRHSRDLPILSPAIELARTLPVEDLRRLALGISGNDDGRALPLLDRFSKDRDTRLQVVSQGIITGRGERLERQLRGLATRAESQKPDAQHPALGRSLAAVKQRIRNSGAEPPADLAFLHASTRWDRLRARFKEIPESEMAPELKNVRAFWLGRPPDAA